MIRQQRADREVFERRGAVMRRSRTMWSIYDGQVRAGRVVRTNIGFDAFEATDHIVGTFNTIKLAADAVMLAFETKAAAAIQSVNEQDRETVS